MNNILENFLKKHYFFIKDHNLQYPKQLKKYSEKQLKEDKKHTLYHVFYFNKLD